MKINPNQLDRGYLKYKSEYDNAILKTLESGWYILGKEVESFEHKFKHFIGSNYCVGLNSGLDALILSFRALKIGVAPFSVIPNIEAIYVFAGTITSSPTPILVEPDEFYNIDATKIENAITVNTKAILVVHLYGQAANMKKIKDIATLHNLFIIEDCAQSHGAKFNGKTTGTWGDIGCFSFYPTKNLGAFGDAGCIVTDNYEIYKQIKLLRNYGSEIKYENEILGINSRLDEIQASVLNVKLGHYSELSSERISLANLYLNKINNSKLILPKIREFSDAIWHLFVVQIENRTEFQEYLMRHGIGTQIHYPIPPHLSRAYNHLGYKKGDFPITESFANTLVSLPLYDGMTEEEIMYVINTINNY